MAQVHVQSGETLENALKRFKSTVQQNDVIEEIKRRSFDLKVAQEERRAKADWPAISPGKN